MSNKDVKKGIALQAEADAGKIEKLSKGLTAHKAVLKSLESGQGEIREAMGILLDDMSASESNMLFDLQIRKTPGELDDTEMRVLCACLYTLLSKTGQNSPSQITFYSNLEKYLGIAERKDDFDFFTLSNIDSHTDRLVILKAVCSFLYLNSESFSFLREKDDFSWLYAFAPIKDIADVCSAINSEHAVLGVNGILGNYDPLLAPKREMQEKYFRLKSEIQDGNEQLLAVEEGITDRYEALKSLIIKRVSDERAFGEGVAFSEDEFRKELSNITPAVAFDAFIVASKLDRGNLIFTTHAVYLKADGLLKTCYAELPYSDIQADRIVSEAGRQSGTRKITIPVVDGIETKRYVIDDTKLEEEKLRNLLVEISASEIATSEEDKEIPVNYLSADEKRRLVAAAIYALKQEDYPLTDLYMLAIKWGLEDWNSMATTIKDDGEFSDVVRNYISKIPYPSERVTSIETAKLIMALVSRGNILAGEEASKLSLNMENRIRSFASEDIPSKVFNLMQEEAINLIKDEAHCTYTELRDTVGASGLEYSENILSGTGKIIERIEASLDYKAKQSFKKVAKDFAEAADVVHDIVSAGAADVAEKAKKGLNDLLRREKKN